MPSPATPNSAGRSRTVVLCQARWSAGSGTRSLTIASVSLPSANYLSPVAQSGSEAGEQLAPLQLVETAPDPVRLTDLEGVVEAGLLDRTGGADGLGPLLPLLLLVLAFHVRRREEHPGLGAATGSLHLPRISGALARHDTPFPSPPANIPLRRAPRQGAFCLVRLPRRRPRAAAAPRRTRATPPPRARRRRCRSTHAGRRSGHRRRSRPRRGRGGPSRGGESAARPSRRRREPASRRPPRRPSQSRQ